MAHVYETNDVGTSKCIIIANDKKQVYDSLMGVWGIAGIQKRFNQYKKNDENYTTDNFIEDFIRQLSDDTKWQFKAGPAVSEKTCKELADSADKLPIFLFKQ